MSLKYAILGLLAGGPKHGYAIGRELSRLLNGLWPVNPGQVYATLERLARDELVARAPAPAATTPQPAPGAPASAAARLRPFVVLPAGRRALRRWLDRPLGCALQRSPFAERLVLHAWASDRDAIARLLAVHRNRCAALHRLLESAAHGGAAARPIDSAAAESADALQLVARAARRHLEAELEWSATAEQVLVAAARDRSDG